MGIKIRMAYYAIVWALWVDNTGGIPVGFWYNHMKWLYDRWNVRDWN